ncbi:hypothetical protein PC120_g23764 [Phytophthora cactorum]|nr:hypothetical protein PC120_g23764 [Phytophthora cactorum]
MWTGKYHIASHKSSTQTVASTSMQRKATMDTVAVDSPDLVPTVEEKCEAQQKREREAECPASPKRQKTEGNISARSSDNTRRGSILPERRQSEKAENITKLDAIMESNKRLEAMQRQQLKMLQQLCASNNVMSSITLGKRNVGSD